MNKDRQRIKIAEACGWKLEQYEHCWPASLPVKILNRLRKPDGKIFLFRGSWGDEWPCRTWEDALASNVIPDYLNDLNACAEMEESIPLIKRQRYWDILEEICTHKNFKAANLKVGPTVCISAKAEQRCEAFSKTMNLWESGE